MEYKKIINFLDNTPNQPSKFKVKNQVEINYELQGTYNEEVVYNRAFYRVSTWSQSKPMFSLL